MTIANVDVSNQGGSGVSVSGSNNVLRNVSGSGMGCQASSVYGGDFATLTPGNNTVVGCSFTQYARFCRTYQPGLSWGGVGNSFINNTVGDAPHTGAEGGGNDNLFRGNLFTDLAYESSDTGAWYTGRSWVTRGNIVEGNTFVRIRNTIGACRCSPAGCFFAFRRALCFSIIPTCAAQASIWATAVCK